MMNAAFLRRHYRNKRREIERALNSFALAGRSSEEEIFAELAYCILTAQAKALEADTAVKRLKGCGLLYRGTARQIKPYLLRVRFLNKKARYIVEARRKFTRHGSLCITPWLAAVSPDRLREDLVSHIDGFGYKEASHFLRNVGLGGDFAILDRYIMRCLKGLGVIRKVPSSMTKRRYLSMEGRMRRFAKRAGIPLSHLDLALWSSQTGMVFK